MENNTALLVLRQEMDWLSAVITQCMTSYFLQEGHEKEWTAIPMPDLSLQDGPYADAVREWNLDIYSRLAIALSMAPHLCPEVLDLFFTKNKLHDRGFTEFGGLVAKDHNGFLPTGDTLCFLITVHHPELRYEVMNLLGKSHILIKEEVLILTETEINLPRFRGQLSLSESWLNYFLTGERQMAENSASFPAQHIHTEMEWDDVVLDRLVLEQLNEITSWLAHGPILMEDWGLKKQLKPGYRALFYGPPGTGKTLTATLIGKTSGRKVYKIDLSMLVSKYIGETEKNLSRVFDIAQHQHWILFFDEADALFGKRSTADSANDRHANQQTAYLLQRIEDFPGVVILATNLKANMDEAFARRFQAIIHFTLPSVEERYELWKKAFSGICKLDENIDLYAIAKDYPLTGGAMINVLRFCALSVISRAGTVVRQGELLAGIKREFKKENRTLINSI
ncbi:AAA family ATPase [Pedobacter sp. PACM 27299]|uniref:ATP-binding protein n=1 Tax=Pedobacter sp. PACM 27299 TaxID=1727164 RepID=UPI0007065E25|nr:ATP-binding protein [Pedobacter sp. PACM 27299]ALL06189.1 AAA family ATPase [Pedobacter sp. PACM 27299]